MSRHLEKMMHKFIFHFGVYYFLFTNVDCLVWELSIAQKVSASGMCADVHMDFYHSF